MNEHERYWTITDLCNVYSLKESWVRRQIFLKRIPYLKFGRLIRFEIEKIEKWIRKAQPSIDDDYFDNL
ncbi:MAG: helix-turn-helix domain-containing protein [Bacteriovoracaceae bacterium]